MLAHSAMAISNFERIISTRKVTSEGKGEEPIILGRIQVSHKGSSVSDRRRRELLEGSGGMLPREILKFVPSEMRFPAFGGGLI